MKISRTKLMSGSSLLCRVWQKVYLLALVLFVTACNGSLFLLKDRESPTHFIDSRAASFGMERSIVDSGQFKHVVYARQPTVKAVESNTTGGVDSSERLHVYIEGDGVAWRSRFVISEDPTSRNVLMLDLMAMDSARSLYLGRPCYLGRSGDPGCQSELWTYDRFSDSVVDSMVTAIRASAENAANKKVSEIVLFGHSGGAALAILIAARMPQVEAIVTVAGNLDINAWVKHHRYTPLFGSLNPALQPPLSSKIRQLHLLGERDNVIPPELVKGWIEDQPEARIWQFADYTHNCCWKQQWSKVLNWVETGVSPVLSGAL